MSEEQVQDVAAQAPVEQLDTGAPDAGLVDGGGQPDVPADPAPVADPVTEEPAAAPVTAFDAAMGWINELAETAPAPQQMTFLQYLMHNIDGLRVALKDY